MTQLAELIQSDLSEGYPALRSAAVSDEDRGTQRICVWGEKVTNILNILLQRWEKEGDAFMQDTEVWVCTVCGFVYIGDTAPELCPVCKVPAWKFEKSKGGFWHETGSGKKFAALHQRLPVSVCMSHRSNGYREQHY